MGLAATALEEAGAEHRPPGASSSDRLAPLLVSLALHLGVVVILVSWGFSPPPREPDPMVLEVQWEQPPPAPDPQAIPAPAPAPPQVRTEQPRRTASKPLSKAAPVPTSAETSPDGADTPPETAGDSGQDVSVPTAAPTAPSHPTADHLVPQVKVTPTYPPQALRRQIEGEVTLEFGVTTAGAVVDIQVVQAQPVRLFEESARTALARWQFTPDAGQPLRRGRITMEFRIRS